MAFTFELTTRARFIEDGTQGNWEELATRSFTGLSERLDKKHSVSSATKVLWDSDADGALADFQVCALVSTQPVELEFTCNNGDAQEELSHVYLAANTAFVLGQDDSRYDYTTDTFSGTLDVIDRIRVKESDALAATVRLILLR